MLARATEGEKQLTRFQEALRLPEATVELLAAEEAFETAKRDRAAASARHSEAVTDQNEAKFRGRIPKFTAEELGARHAEVDHLSSIERDARAERHRLRAERSFESIAILSVDLDALAATVARKLGECEALLAIAAKLDAEARAAGVELDRKIASGANLLARLLAQPKKVAESWLR